MVPVRVGAGTAVLLPTDGRAPSVRVAPLMLAGVALGVREEAPREAPSALAAVEGVRVREALVVFVTVAVGRRVAVACVVATAVSVGAAEACAVTAMVATMGVVATSVAGGGGCGVVVVAAGDVAPPTHTAMSLGHHSAEPLEMPGATEGKHQRCPLTGGFCHRHGPAVCLPGPCVHPSHRPLGGRGCAVVSAGGVGAGDVPAPAAAVPLLVRGGGNGVVGCTTTVVCPPGQHAWPVGQ